ncbi:GNAT family N-acetyltransferase [Paenibacillus polysaccharolyticus]|uniref:GNAT family N-acetyltransferase n=1 Tax=Paenibacillus polysaccharolyticus TaxID=582692 RepID=UPI00204087C1|nr:GNAT family N-acetyltransferase [Paenibacillus polysaccharolyticus]MCM3134292.1 GNAT family N-acetyltransferase [Paenibacillus polysaccharolyticus]
MSLDVNIRHSTNQDVQDMVILMDQLGYPTTYAEMQERYAHIAADANFTTLVAEVRGRVVGLIGMQTSYSYEKNGRHCRIMALVVHEHYRGSGIGRQLLLAAEQWAAEQQVDSLSLNSGNRADREAAHAFYQRMGYTAGSTGFSKNPQLLQHN